MRDTLTPTQLNHLRTFARLRVRLGVSPTMREFVRAAGLSGSPGKHVFDLWRTLQRKGVLRLGPRCSVRTATLTRKGWELAGYPPPRELGLAPVVEPMQLHACQRCGAQTLGEHPQELCLLLMSLPV